MGSDDKEDIRTKIYLMLLEKLVLALVIAGAGFFFNFLLQQEKTRGDYQKQIFDRRVQAYITILEDAKKARDGLAVLYFASEFGYSSLGELEHQQKLNDLLQQSNTLDSGFSSGSRRDYRSHKPVIESLVRLEQVARENDLYISQRVKERVGNFMDVAMSDLPKSLEYTKQERASFQLGETIAPEVSSADKEFRQAAWQRAEEAYQMLLEEIRDSLRVEGIPLG